MADLELTLACWSYDRTRALMDGSVKPDGIALKYESLFPAATFQRMMGKHEFDASELGLTFYLDTLHYDDPPFVAIPAYPIRLFSHSAIYINTTSGIERPQDLIGKKIGEFFLYGHDAGTWVDSPPLPELKRFLASEIERWGGIVEKAGVAGSQ